MPLSLGICASEAAAAAAVAGAARPGGVVGEPGPSPGWRGGGEAAALSIHEVRTRALREMVEISINASSSHHGCPRRPRVARYLILLMLHGKSETWRQAALSPMQRRRRMQAMYVSTLHISLLHTPRPLSLLSNSLESLGDAVASFFRQRLLWPATTDCHPDLDAPDDALHEDMMDMNCTTNVRVAGSEARDRRARLFATASCTSAAQAKSR